VVAAGGQNTVIPFFPVVECEAAAALMFTAVKQLAPQAILARLEGSGQSTFRESSRPRVEGSDSTVVWRPSRNRAVLAVGAPPN
jgi:hypothetical protein